MMMIFSLRNSFNMLRQDKLKREIVNAYQHESILDDVSDAFVGQIAAGHPPRQSVQFLAVRRFVRLHWTVQGLENWE